MYPDYKDLLSAFHAHGVKYLVVGGFAVIYHSQPRFTKDMDLFTKIRRRPHNVQAGVRTAAGYCGRGRHSQGGREPAARRKKKAPGTERP
jgi:hypothetical protein